MKRLLLAISLAILAIVLFCTNGTAEGYYLPDGTREFQLGDGIQPSPRYGNCNDGTIYLLIALESMGYHPTIQYGKAPDTPEDERHVWLEIDGWIYDRAFVHQQLDQYKIIKPNITYRQLLGSAMLD